MEYPFSHSPACSMGTVRLVNGSNSSQGRVEMCYNNTWGTICGDTWTINEAVVVCNGLGYYGSLYWFMRSIILSTHISGSASISNNAYFGQGAGAILLNGVTCNGSEASLLLCHHGNSIIGSTSCTHRNDAGVNCSSGQYCTLSLFKLQ